MVKTGFPKPSRNFQDAKIHGGAFIYLALSFVSLHSSLFICLFLVFCDPGH
jgi:hypothetical protein